MGKNERGFARVSGFPSAFRWRKGNSTLNTPKKNSPDTLDVSTSVLIPSVVAPLDRHGVLINYKLSTATKRRRQKKDKRLSALGVPIKSNSPNK